MATSKHVVVAGSGVIGLTAAVSLLEQYADTGLRVTVVSDWLPEDVKSVMHASAQAGAHHVSHARVDDEKQIALDRYTLGVLSDEYDRKVTDSLMWIDQYEYYTADADNGSDMDALIKVGMPDIRKLREKELLPGTARGVTFKTLTIDTQSYLLYLVERLTKGGGRIVRAKLDALSDIPSLSAIGSKQHPVSAIVNCTGLGSLHLADVKDAELFPVRGQLCIIRAPWLKHGRGIASKGATSYTIPRSSGLVIVGGTRNANDWHDQPRPETTKTILETALRYDRDLLPPNKREKGVYTDIEPVSEAVGRRPGRKSGVRFELDTQTIPGIPILHNYGHAGFGWQSSWGYAKQVVDTLAPYLA